MTAAPRFAPSTARQRANWPDFPAIRIEKRGRIAGSTDRFEQAEGLAGERLENDERNELFGKLARSVIVRAVRDHDRQPIGRVPGMGQVIGGGLAGRVRRTRAMRRIFVEPPGRAERTEYLVGRDVHE